VDTPNGQRCDSTRNRYHRRAVDGNRDRVVAVGFQVRSNRRHVNAGLDRELEEFVTQPMGQGLANSLSTTGKHVDVDITCQSPERNSQLCRAGNIELECPTCIRFTCKIVERLSCRQRTQVQRRVESIFRTLAGGTEVTIVAVTFSV